jgi:hypothetical protein
MRAISLGTSMDRNTDIRSEVSRERGWQRGDSIRRFDPQLRWLPKRGEWRLISSLISAIQVPKSASPYVKELYPKRGVGWRSGS